ncbi:MAG: hypothetical protein WBN20_15065, partial [Eudoraea sp.]|uniref:hypothetical protein n=1 Tax=Eudoraea sp. TaxID=1979955 RepID=UPI003C781C9F
MKPIDQSFSKTFFQLAIVAVLLFSFSCSPEADMDALENIEAVNASANKEKQVERPWKIRSAGTFEFDPSSVNLCDPLLPLKIVGSGEASHIGRYAVELTWCTGGPGNQGFDAITGVITSANGDTIVFKSVLGSFTANSVDYIVTGGSGLFDGAGGEFTLFATEPTMFTNGPGEPPSGTYANAGEGY